LFCLISGQSSLLTAAMLVAIFALLDRKPVAAGVLIGLLSIKPQLGILFPFMLMASGRWRVFIAAAATALALAGVTAAIFGTRVVRFRQQRPCRYRAGCWRIRSASRRRSFRPYS
jgi:hypothetical protein